MDNISQLPQPILHRILSFLSQNDAVKTCVLSKSWRYLWYARPNLEFHQSDFPGNTNTNTFMSVLNTALQRCHDQNLTIQDFFLEMLDVVCSKSTQLLEKWISIVLQNKGLKTFRLHILRQQNSASAYFDLCMLKSESLRELHLQGCMLNWIDSINNIMLKNLRTLSLTRVHISEASVENIFSSCALLENLSLLGCEGLETINLMSNNKPNGLKHFVIEHFKPGYNELDIRLITVEIGISTIETITIVECRFHHHYNYFPNLKSLTLKSLRLSNKSFDFFSSIYMPRLECLTLNSCYGFEEIKMLLSDSVKHVTTRNPMGHDFTNAVIDAPNIVTFAYDCKINLQLGSVSFATNSIEWESNINVSFYDNFDTDPSSWFGKVHEQLGALSGSRVSLELSQVKHREPFEVHYGRKNPPRGIEDEQGRVALYERVPDIIFCERDYEPVAVEHLSLRGRYTHSSLAAFLYCLFRISHPRYVGQDLFSNAQSEMERDDKELTLLLFVILIMEKEMREQILARGFGRCEDGKL